MARLRSVLTLGSIIKYMIWKCRGRRHIIQLRTRSGVTARFRPKDLGIFYEIFVSKIYEPPADMLPGTVTNILDLGGYVGFSVLFWLSRFPGAKVTVYEPHPDHVEMIEKQLELNGWKERVTLRAAGAGVSAGNVHLTENAAGSAITADGGPQTVPVQLVDLFSDIGDRRFDIAKIDIEGGEYPLFDDERFAWLQATTICMETHPNTDRKLDEPGAMKFVRNLLERLGYRTKVKQETLWATKMQV